MNLNLKQALVGTMLVAAGFNAQASDPDPIKVFILAGQSNMVGFGATVEGRDPDFVANYDPNTDVIDDSSLVGRGGSNVPGVGSLQYLVETQQPGTYGFGGTTPLVDSNSDWLVRSDVNVYAQNDADRVDPSDTGNILKGGLGIGFGRRLDRIGPEFGFGHVIGNALDDDVLIIKVATGGTSVGVHWLSPTAVAAGRTGNGTSTGVMYTRMIDTVDSVLSNLGTEFAEYAGRDAEIVGFAWNQGVSDDDNTDRTASYEDNLTDFIADVRSAEHGFGISDLPFVIATTSMLDAPTDPDTKRAVELAQLAIGDADPLTTTVDTTDFYRDPLVSPRYNQGHHWNLNAESYLLTGTSMGEEMLALVPEPSSLMLLSLGGLGLLRRRRA